MINEDQIHLASTAMNFLQKKGSSFYQEFMKTNSDKIRELEIQVSGDKSNFFGYSLERKKVMANVYSTGIVYILTLSEDAQSIIRRASQKQLTLDRKTIKSAIYF